MENYGHNFTLLLETKNTYEKMTLKVDLKSNDGQSKSSKEQKEIKKKGNGYPVTSEILAQMLSSFIDFKFYFEYFSLSFFISIKGQSRLLHPPRLFYYPQVICKNKVISFPETQFNVTLWADFKNIENFELVLGNSCGGEQGLKMKKSSEGWYYGPFLIDYPDGPFKAISYCYSFKQNIKEVKLQLKKNLRFSFEEIPSKLVVVNSEINIRDSNLLNKVKEGVYSILYVYPAVVEEIAKAMIEVVLFYDENEQKEFDALNKSENVKSMLFEVKDNAISKQVILDSINFFFEGETLPLCICGLEKYISEFNINLNEIKNYF